MMDIFRFNIPDAVQITVKPSLIFSLVCGQVIVKTVIFNLLQDLLLFLVINLECFQELVNPVPSSILPPISQRFFSVDILLPLSDCSFQ